MNRDKYGINRPKWELSEEGIENLKKLDPKQFKVPEHSSYKSRPNFKRRRVEDFSIMTYAEFYEKVSKIEKQSHKALIALLYLSGCRVSEIVGRVRGSKPLKVADLEVMEVSGKNFLVLKNVLCLKRKMNKKTGLYPKVRRNIPIPVDEFKPLLQIIVDYRNSIGDRLDRPLWFISRQWVYELVQLYLGVFPHYLRHLRLSHLAERGFSDSDLRQFTGWVTSKTAANYVHLNWHTIAKRMIQEK